MIRNSPFCYRWILPGEAGAGQRDSELLESVGNSGVIAPPLLADPETVILGHRRLAAALSAGLSEVEVLIFEPADDRKTAGSETEISSSGKDRENIYRPFASLWLNDLPVSEGLSELEKIIVAKKAITHFPSDPGPVLPALGRVFGRKLTSSVLAEMTGLLRHPPDILGALHRGDIRAADLIQLSSRKEIDIGRAVRLFLANSMSRAEQKETVRLFGYLADQGEERWKAFADDYERSGGDLIDLLKSSCYPALAADSLAIEEIISSIGLPQHAKIVPPENLDGGAYDLKIRIREEERLRAVLDKIGTSLDEGKIAALLAILRGRRGM